jgi:hypothetical protein
LRIDKLTQSLPLDAALRTADLRIDKLAQSLPLDAKSRTAECRPVLPRIDRLAQSLPDSRGGIEPDTALLVLITDMGKEENQMLTVVVVVVVVVRMSAERKWHSVELQRQRESGYPTHSHLRDSCSVQVDQFCNHGRPPCYRSEVRGRR